MAPKPLDILKEGLNKFSNKIKTRKDALILKISRRESISSADERWLDHEANTVEEERILHVLTETCDREIYQAVMDAVKARENIDINGGDDIGNDILISAKPPQLIVMCSRQCQRSMSIIEDLDDPISRKMEALLAYIFQRS